MITIQNILNRVFPWMAVAGLLLAAWGLLITPDEVDARNQNALWSASGSSSAFLASVEDFGPSP